MATPKVFISSTCYDLSQVRDNLHEFVESFFYEPVLSEKGDVFYHPDLHTHESCINEIKNCHLFILIIGGRFGGEYKFDESKSITNAEYEAAKIRNIPVFTFIKQDVYNDHRVYQKNKHNQNVVSQIEFPSIEKQIYAKDIFEFINYVKKSDTNNGFFSFEYANDIKNHLGKQWAGMMFNFLDQRIRNNEERMVKQTLDSLALINTKTEELIENIYKKIDPENSTSNIINVDKIILGTKFYQTLSYMFENFNLNSLSKNISEIIPKHSTWYEYIADFNYFKLDNAHIEDDFNTELFLSDKNKSCFWSVKTHSGRYPEYVIKMKELYENLKTLSIEDVEKSFNQAINN